MLIDPALLRTFLEASSRQVEKPEGSKGPTRAPIFRRRISTGPLKFRPGVHRWLSPEVQVFFHPFDLPQPPNLNIYSRVLIGNVSSPLVSSRPLSQPFRSISVIGVVRGKFFLTNIPDQGTRDCSLSLTPSINAVDRAEIVSTNQTECT